MNNLQVFNYNNSEIRTVMKSGEPWWVLKDVCDVLGISDHKVVSRRLEEDEVCQTPLTDSLGRNQDTTIINESGLYNVILRSDKPEAKPFKKWVTSDVLPTIRKTGGYVANEQAFIDTYLPYADENTRALFSATLQTVRSLNTKIEQDKPKVLFADAVSTSKTSILIGELAKIMKQNGVNTGEKRLFNFLRENGYLIKRKGTDYNMPTQKSMELALFEVKETVINHSDGHVTVNKTPKVTGRGQQFFLNKFLS